MKIQTHWQPDGVYPGAAFFTPKVERPKKGTKRGRNLPTSNGPTERVLAHLKDHPYQSSAQVCEALLGKYHKRNKSKWSTYGACLRRLDRLGTIDSVDGKSPIAKRTIRIYSLKVTS